MNAGDSVTDIRSSCGFHGKEKGRLKKTNYVFGDVTETKQPTGYKTISIILSKLHERKAWNKISQITHRSVWNINSCFRAQTKKEKNMPPTENGIPNCESKAIYGMYHFPSLKYPLRFLFFSSPLSWQTVKSHLHSNCEPGLSLTGK